jgi:hypothetical protein
MAAMRHLPQHRTGPAKMDGEEWSQIPQGFHCAALCPLCRTVPFAKRGAFACALKCGEKTKVLVSYMSPLVLRCTLSKFKTLYASIHIMLHIQYQPTLVIPEEAG